MTTVATSIQIENLTKSFPGVVALDKVTLEIYAGEFFTLLGPSGCGKTTLLRTIAGFYTQDSGHIRAGGELLDQIPAYKRDVGMVFQNYAVFPHMTVAENVAFGLKNRKVPKDQITPRVTRALETVRLSGYESRTPEKLSGGQQQRVGLARAMVIEPRMLLLDEPLSNLDAKLRLHMREEILDIQRGLGTTSVYVTHDQEEALVISDRIAVMNFGEVQQVGTPWQLYRDPVNRFVATFVGSMNVFEASTLMQFVENRKNLESALPADDKNRKIQVTFRPEDASLLVWTDQEASKSLRIQGTVEKSLFQGPRVVYRIALGSESVLTVEEYVSKRSEMREEGSEVTVTVAYEKLLFFDADSGVRVTAEV